MNEASSSAPEIPGRPFGYYLQVLRRRWVYLVAGFLVGVLAGVGFLMLRPQSVTSSSVVELSIITSDPFGLDRAPSSLLDVGTEQQVARSYLVAEQAAEELDGVMTPAQVRSASDVSIGSEGTVVTINFTAYEEALARAGADAVARSFLEARGEQVEGRINDQLTAIEDRLLELQADQAELLDAADEDGETSSLVESRDQLIRDEIQALVQQRTNLNSVSTSGGRVLTTAEVSEVSYAPSKMLVLASAAMVGLLGGLMLAFVRQRFSHRVADVAEVEAVTGAPVLQTGKDEARWDIPGAILVGMLPSGRSTLVLVNLATNQDLEEVTTALRQAIDRDPASEAQVSVVDGWLREGATSFAAIRGARTAALVVNPRVANTADLEQLMAVLNLLGISVAASYWCVRQADHRKGLSKSSASRPRRREGSEL